MRRDVAVARGQNGEQAGATVPSAPLELASTVLHEVEAIKPETLREVSPPPEEVSEPPASKKDLAEPPKVFAALKVEEPKSPKKRPSPQPEEEPPAKRQAVGDNDPTKLEADAPEAKLPGNALQIDTKPPTTDAGKEAQSGEELSRIHI